MTKAGNTIKETRSSKAAMKNRGDTAKTVRKIYESSVDSSEDSEAEADEELEEGTLGKRSFAGKNDCRWSMICTLIGTYI
jgi:phage shock protein A